MGGRRVVGAARPSMVQRMPRACCAEARLVQGRCELSRLQTLGGCFRVAAASAVKLPPRPALTQPDQLVHECADRGQRGKYLLGVVTECRPLRAAHERQGIAFEMLQGRIQRRNPLKKQPAHDPAWP